MITLKQLECFRAVMATGQMVAAARDMNISQPAASKLIDGLEYGLSLKLFERRRGRIDPTPEARIILSHIESGIAAIEKIERTAREINRHQHGSLVVAGMPGFAMHVIPLAVADLLSVSEDVRVSILSRSNRTLDEVLNARQFDVAVLQGPVTHPGVIAEPFDLRCVCALPEDHPLTAHEVIRAEDLDGVKFISLTEEQELSGIISRLFSVSGTMPDTVVHAQFFAAAAMLVAQGVGVSIIDPISAEIHKANGLVIRPFEPAVDLHLGIALPVDHPPSQIVTRFVDLLKHRLGQKT